MAPYLDCITEAMTELGKDSRTIFLGQAIAYPGTAMTKTFEGVPRNQLLELPVFEDTQLGMAIGLSLQGYLPVCVYPRINFLLLAMNQLILHLDALPRYSDYRPRVIIRTAVAHDEPLNPGAQHLGDYSNAIEVALAESAITARSTVNVDVVRLLCPGDVTEAYREAASSRCSTVVVEYHRLYDRDR